MAKDLREAFEQASTLFNAARYDDLGAMLDCDVVLKRVGSPGLLVGIGDVIVYLNTHQKPQNPQLLNPKISYQLDKGTWGIVSGTAEYKNKQGDSGTTTVQFTFIFARSDPNSDWLIINLFAVPTK